MSTTIESATRTRIDRRVERVSTLAPPAPGFGGAGHEAVFVVEPSGFDRQDPFIMLADDRIDMPPGVALGGAHPHAGFEIATYVVEGGIDEGEEGVLEEGDVLWTTAGRGLIHGERAVPRGPTRILQLWFTLPVADRWVDPHFDVIRRNDAPVRHEAGARVRVYSGTSGEAHVRRAAHVPVTMVDIRLEAGARFTQHFPAAFNGFLYVLSGSVRIGDTSVDAGQVGWLDWPREDVGTAVESSLQLIGGTAGAHAVLYAGEPQRHAIATHGPFVGGSRADLFRMSRDYVAGRFTRMSELVRVRGGFGVTAGARRTEYPA